MRKLLTIGIAALLLLGGGVFAAEECGTMCPPEDVVIYYLDPIRGPVPIKITKGMFDNPDSYFTMDQWEKMTGIPQQKEKTEEPKESEGGKEL